MKLLCINSKDKPKEIPQSKFVKEGEWYELLMVIRCMPANVIGFELVEPTLDETCLPFSCFLGDRFAILENDITEFIELCKSCAELDNFSIEELMEQSQLEVLTD